MNKKLENVSADEVIINDTYIWLWTCLIFSHYFWK
jgi:hypothetical protein